MTPPIEDVQPSESFTCSHCGQPYPTASERDSHEPRCPNRPRNPTER